MSCGYRDYTDAVCGVDFTCESCGKDANIEKLREENQELAARVWCLNDENEAMREALKAIAQDNACGQHHDAMAKSALPLGKEKKHLYDGKKSAILACSLRGRNSR